MKNRKKITITAAWIISVIIAYYFGKAADSFKAFSQPVTVGDAILSADKRKSIWIKKHAWGITGNHQVIYLTDDKFKEAPDEGQDIVFHDDETIFYRTNGDTLQIFTRNDYEIDPLGFEGFYIKIHELNNPKFMNLYDEVHSSVKTTDWMR